MTYERMIELLQVEHECVLRKSHGDCDSQCDACDLVQDDGEPHEMYSNVIGLLKAQEPKPVHVNAKLCHRKIGECPSCGKPINSDDYPNYCSKCGQAVKWE